MTRVGVPADAQPIIRAAFKFVTCDELYTVHSLSYGALAFRAALWRASARPTTGSVDVA